MCFFDQIVRQQKLFPHICVCVFVHTNNYARYIPIICVYAFSLCEYIGFIKKIFSPDLENSDISSYFGSRTV